jgi:uncharacterized damage-inducible protein DinB
MGRAGARVTQLLTILDQAYNRKSWHGTNLRGSLRRLTPDQAVWHPGEGRHNIHELVVHAAYWKYAVANRLAGGQRGAFPIAGSNWFERSGAAPRQWSDDLALLDRIHRDLRAVVSTLRDADLDRPLPKSRMTPFALIAGVAAHDLYHAGQIQLIKALQRR